MQGEHADFRQVRRCGNRSCNCVGDVVELQIEEDAKAEAREFFYSPRAFSREKLESNFEKARCATEPPRQGAGWP